MNSGPVAQFSPIEQGARCSSDTHSASTPWPASIVPVGSIVALTISGSVDAGSRCSASRTPSAAALTLSVSWQVSSSSASTPPAMSPAACTR